MAPDVGGGNADYYDILGVPDTASSDDIIRAYRRLARQHHPDSNPEEGGSQRFKEITDAYDVIGDVERRRRYDAGRSGGAGRGIRIPINRPGGAATGPAGTGAGPAASPSAPAGARGAPVGARPGPAAPADRPTIRLSFQEAVLGTVATVEVPEEQTCPGCGGTGVEQVASSRCPDCGGTGSLIRQTGQIPVRHICARCAGRGRPVPRACTMCGATGTVSGTRPVKVRVPAGVTEGATLRIRRPKGPVEAVVRVDPDPRFGREGDNVTVRVPVTPAEAALGAVVEVPAVDGAALSVRIPPGTQPGRRLRLAGRGVRRADRVGDLLVTVDVVVPRKLTDTERAAYEALAAVSENPRATL